MVKNDTKTQDYDIEVMEELEANPVGKRKQFLNRKGELTEPRKVHMAKDEFKVYRDRWLEETKDVLDVIKNKAGIIFFNPYRHAGSYYGLVQSLFLLGANSWHDDKAVRGMVEQVMMSIKDSKGAFVWYKFAHRVPRSESLMAKDLRGRIHQNLRVLQRLGGRTPYGYKLKQLLTCIDIRPGVNGSWEYRLNTEHSSESEVIPFYDPGIGERRGRKKRLPLRGEAVVRDIVIGEVSQAGEKVV